MLVGLFLASADANSEKSQINLGRLKETIVSASSINGARNGDNPFYGVKNCFDGGRNIINNINYSYWLSGTPGDHGQHSINVRFPTAVKIDELWIITPGLSQPPPLILSEESPKTTENFQSRRPWEYALDITYGVGEAAVTKRVPSFWLIGFRHKVKIEEKLEGVTALKFIFLGRGNIEIEEIEILGPLPACVAGVNEGPQLHSSKTQ